MKNRIAAVAATAALSAAALVATAAPALAGGPLLYAGADDHGKRWSICADSLQVRSAPNGPAIGYLYRNETFRIDDTGGSEFGDEYISGFAFGGANKNGWVQNGWFCLSNGG